MCENTPLSDPEVDTPPSWQLTPVPIQLFTVTSPAIPSISSLQRKKQDKSITEKEMRRLLFEDLCCNWF